jgi:hypothetical protein
MEYTLPLSELRLAFNRIVVLRYRSHLESRQLARGTINLLLGAVRRLAYDVYCRKTKGPYAWLGSSRRNPMIPLNS